MNRRAMFLGVMMLLMLAVCSGVALAGDMGEIRAGQVKTGTVAATDPVTYSFANAGYAKVTMNLTADVGIKAALLRPNGTSMISTTIAASGSGQGSNYTYLNPGAYSVQITGNGNYSVELAMESVAQYDAEPNDDFEHAIRLTIPQTVYGLFSGAHDSDFYKFTLTETTDILVRSLITARGTERKLVMGISGGYYYSMSLVEGAQWTARLKPGDYVITAQSNSSGPYQFEIDRAVMMESLSISPAEVEFYKAGETAQLAAIALPTNQSEKIYWKSSNEAVATVDKSTGLVTAVGSGTATITAYTLGEYMTAKATAYFHDPQTKKFTLPKTFKGSAGLIYAVKPKTRRGYEAPPLRWSSSKSSVASVTSKGVITAYKSGKTTITAKTQDGKVKQSMVMTVVPNEYRRNTPYKGKRAGVYTSTKRLYYMGDLLHVEVYVYNYSPYKVQAAYGYYLTLYDRFNPVDDDDDEGEGTGANYFEELDWDPGVIGPYKYKVFTCTLPRSKFNYDLGRHQIEAYVTCEKFFRVKGGSAKEQFTGEPIAPMLKEITAKEVRYDGPDMIQFERVG